MRANRLLLRERAGGTLAECMGQGGYRGGGFRFERGVRVACPTGELRVFSGSCFLPSPGLFTDPRSVPYPFRIVFENLYLSSRVVCWPTISCYRVP